MGNGDEGQTSEGVVLHRRIDHLDAPSHPRLRTRPAGTFPPTDASAPEDDEHVRSPPRSIAGGPGNRGRSIVNRAEHHSQAHSHHTTTHISQCLTRESLREGQWSLKPTLRSLTSSHRPCSIAGRKILNEHLVLGIFGAYGLGGWYATRNGDAKAAAPAGANATAGPKTNGPSFGAASS